MTVIYDTVLKVKINLFLTPLMNESMLFSMNSFSSQKTMLNVWWWGS